MSANQAASALDMQTTGDLRQFLAGMLTAIQNGDLPVDRASQITKMAGQINESFYSEVKVWLVRKAAGDADTKLGTLPLNAAKNANS